jgi:hypothetical protein
MTRAQFVNSRFAQTTSKFVSVKQRIEDYCARVDTAADELEMAIKEFRKNNPTLTYDKIRLARAASCKLSDLRIDDTMNRPLQWQHVIKIIKNFKQTKIMGISVYEDPTLPGKMIAWDGQHTSIVLYIIFVMIYEQSASTIDVPIVIYDTHDKAEIRENFIELNGDGKEPISPLAFFGNMVFGVRLDGATREDWVLANEKQLLLENAGLFLTSKDYGDASEPGAITKVVDFTDHKVPVKHVEYFSKYWMRRKSYEDRRVENKEVVMFFNLIREFDSNNIAITDKMIEKITDIMWNTFECEFTGTKTLNKFWQKLHTAYHNWYQQVHNVKFKPVKEADKGGFNSLPDSVKENLPTYYMMTVSGDHQNIFGTTFLIYQLKKSGFKGKLPKPLNEFKPDLKDLW